ncbi:MAG TPA: c-type cytochrome [Terriglobia bacterium]|nr:c-type cytochrome [Terriglobia bacterium]
MRTAFRLAGIVLAGLVVFLAIGISLTIGWRPFLGPKARPLTDRKFERTPERLARGKYLVEGLGCFDCHGEHDWTKHDAPLIEGTRGAGYASFPMSGLPGRVVPPNISPDPETGAGNWTDDQLARAIREGIGHDGRALFPFMPYPGMAQLSDEDLASMIVYLRSLPPVRKALPKTEIILPVRYLIRNVPQPITSPVPQPDLSTPVKRGQYLVTISACADCHTPQRKGEPIRGLEFAGGFILEGPWGRVASANITPDPSGISYYDEAMFLEMIRTGYVKARKINQIMPWWHFRDLTDEDLKGIFAHLRTFKPVQHRVDNTEPPTLCRICGFSHGAGKLN